MVPCLVLFTSCVQQIVHPFRRRNLANPKTPKTSIAARKNNKITMFLRQWPTLLRRRGTTNLPREQRVFEEDVYGTGFVHRMAQVQENVAIVLLHRYHHAQVRSSSFMHSSRAGKRPETLIIQTKQHHEHPPQYIVIRATHDGLTHKTFLGKVVPIQLYSAFSDILPHERCT